MFSESNRCPTLIECLKNILKTKLVSLLLTREKFNTGAIISAVAAGVFAVSSVVILVTDLKDGDDNDETAARVGIHPTAGGFGVTF